MQKVITFGCRLNLYESSIIEDALDKSDRKNVIVINSCAVTNEAERQVKRAIRKAHKENPDAEIIVVGCAVDLNPDEYRKMAGVTLVLNNKSKLDYRNYVKDRSAIIGESNRYIPQKRARAFVKIQDGCNHSCTFCSITHARGNNISVPVNDVVEQIRILVENGYNEVVLTGVDIADYGLDCNSSLAQLVQRIINVVRNLPRIRLSSIDVAEIDEALFTLIASEPRIMPHLHLSIQSGDNMILKRMKRRHTREQVIDFCKRFRILRPDIVFGADIIAGFPTETDAMFQNTVDLIEDAGITYLHVFPFSPRENTPASKMPQVPQHIKKMRAAQLRGLGDTKSSQFYCAQVNTRQKILMEYPDRGRAENFALVKLNYNAPVKKIIEVDIKGVEGDYLLGG